MFGCLARASRNITIVKCAYTRCQLFGLVVRPHGGRYSEPRGQDHPPPTDETATEMPTAPRSSQHASQQLSLVQQVLKLRNDRPLWPQLEDAVFVCIDLEAYEQNQDIITEVGIAVLDARELQPKQTTEELISKIKAAHFRPIEHAKLVNRRWVKGREEHFFGETQWTSCTNLGPLLHRLSATPTSLEQLTDPETVEVSERRNIIFVAHDLTADSKFMSTLGFSINDAANVVERVDTQIVASGTKKNRIGLSRLLRALEINAANLHNAGNDAFYTLQALVTMAVKEYSVPGSVFKLAESMKGQKLPRTRQPGDEPNHQKGVVIDDVEPTGDAGLSSNDLPDKIAHAGKKRHITDIKQGLSQADGPASKKPTMDEPAKEP